LEGRIDNFALYASSADLAVVTGTGVDLESPERKFGRVLGGWISMQVIGLSPAVESVTGGNLSFCEDGFKFLLGCSWDIESIVKRRPGAVTAAITETGLLVVPLVWTEHQEDNDNSLFRPFCLILQPVALSSHSESPQQTFQRIGFGTAIAEPGHCEGSSRRDLKRLITDRWTVMKE
jgi:hypothetical protein